MFGYANTELFKRFVFHMCTTMSDCYAALTSSTSLHFKNKVIRDTSAVACRYVVRLWSSLFKRIEMTIEKHIHTELAVS